jgi:hypothetical protein
LYSRIKVVALNGLTAHSNIKKSNGLGDFLCGIVVEVPGYRPRGPGSIPCATRFSE